MVTINICEPRSGGHRLWYVKLLAVRSDVFETQPAIRIITTPEARGSEDWAMHLSGFDAKLVALPNGGLRAWYKSVLSEAAMRHEVCIVPDGEPSILAWIMASRRLNGVLLLMRPLPQLGSAARIRYVLKLVGAGAAYCRHTGRLKLAFLASGSGRELPTMRHIGAVGISDPVSFEPLERDRSIWLASHGIPDGNTVYALLGALEERKNARFVLKALERSSAPNTTLVMAGRIGGTLLRDVAAVSASVGKRLFVDDRYIDDGELDSWISASDVLVLLYENLGSSGLLLKAARAHTVVLVPVSSVLAATAAAQGCSFVEIDLKSERGLNFSEHLSASYPGSRVGHQEGKPFVSGLLKLACAHVRC